MQGVAPLLRPGHELYPTLFCDDGFTPRSVLPDWATKPICDSLDGHDVLRQWCTRWLNGGTFGQRLSSWHVSQALLAHLLAGSETEDVLSNFRDFFERETCSSVELIGLYGSRVGDAFELDAGVTVQDPVAVMPNVARERLFRLDFRGHSKFELGVAAAPNVALTIEYSVKPFSENLDTVTPGLLAAKMQRAVRALTLAGDGPVVPTQQTSFLSHPFVPYYGFGGMGFSGFPVGLPNIKGGSRVDGDLARNVYHALSKVSAAVLQPLELATDRIARSRTHFNPVDKVLDLGIAAEIVLLHGTGSGELSYRLALRGAYLVGSTPSERRKVFSVLRDLYNHRSSAVHTGKLRELVSDRYDEADVVCTQLILKILHDGTFPDWENLVLG